MGWKTSGQIWMGYIRLEWIGMKEDVLALFAMVWKGIKWIGMRLNGFKLVEMSWKELEYEGIGWSGFDFGMGWRELE